MFFRKRTLLAALFLIGLYIFFAFSPHRSSTGRLPHNVSDRLWASIYLPVMTGLKGATSSVRNFVHDYFYLVAVKRENSRLKNELKVKDLHILSLKERLLTEKSYQSMNDLLASWGFVGVSARVVAYDPFSLSQTVWVSAGAYQGVKIDSPVMTPEGLVGRVIRVFGKTSQILLLIDSHFSVDVVNEQSRVRAMVSGSGVGASLERYPQLAHLEYLNLGDAMNAGDLLLTSGLGPIYPAAIPVGHITQKGRKRVVLPLVDFSSLYEVMILKK